jgi:hypothetical protein
VCTHIPHGFTHPSPLLHSNLWSQAPLFLRPLALSAYGFKRVVRTPHLLIARPAFDLQGLAIRWSAMVPATQWVVCDVALAIHGRCSVAMVPDEVMAACSTSKQKPARNNRRASGTATSTTRWMRLNGPVRESTRLPLEAASHTITLEALFMDPRACRAALTQSLVGVMNGPARRG